MWLSDGEGKNSKNVWWNDLVKAAVERKEVLGDMGEAAKDMYRDLQEKKKV